MNPLYVSLRARVLFWIGWESDINVPADYGDDRKYHAGTKLAKIGISDLLKADMAAKLQPEFKKVFGTGWTKIGPADTIACKTIGDCLTLVCKRARPVYDASRIDMLVTLGSAAKTDVLSSYGAGKQYDSTTKMATLVGSASGKQRLLAGTNQDFREIFLDEWAAFVAKDVDDCKTIGDYINAVCEHCPLASPPAGEIK